jgi:hypothetical protein
MLGCMLFVSILFDLLGFTVYFLRSSGVGQYSIPRRFVIQRQAPALLSSCISSNAPEAGGGGGVVFCQCKRNRKHRIQKCKDPQPYLPGDMIWVTITCYGSQARKLKKSCKFSNLLSTLLNFDQWIHMFNRKNVNRCLCSI